MKRAEILRPVDIAVALRLVVDPGSGYESLAEVLGIGVGGAHRSVRRLEAAHLLARERREVLRENLREFLIHGLRYVFYAEIGAETLGVPTAHASGVANAGRSYVWASAFGDQRGEAISPLFPQAIDLPRTDPAVYLALAVVDSIRIGGVRERREAGAWLQAWLENPERPQP
jgi:hypothetical protein